MDSSIKEGGAYVILSAEMAAALAAIAFTAYLALRALGRSTTASALGAFVYAFAPYHFIRGETHLFLSGYEMLPIGVLIALKMFDEPLPFLRRPDHDGPWWRWRGNWVVLVCAVLLGSTGPYYFAFSMMAVALTAAVASFDRRSLRPARAAFAFICTGLAVFLADQGHQGAAHRRLLQLAIGDMRGKILRIIIGAVEFGVPQDGLQHVLRIAKGAQVPDALARMLGVRGWYSTNILGNRDGEVLDDREAFASKEQTKRGVLEQILSPEVHPELYGQVDHVVTINYYPPRGDHKEGWDNVDLFGWLGYPMQLKVNFLCRDSVLAAPLALDLALLLDLAQRAGESGPQEWLSFYFKAPMPQAVDGTPVHDLFAQKQLLDATLCRMARQWAVNNGRGQARRA